jgi:hypothetical protein
MQEFQCSTFLARAHLCAVELENLPAEISRSSGWLFFKGNNLSASSLILSRTIFLTDHGIRVFVTESVHMTRFASFYPRSQHRLQNVSSLASQCVRFFFFMDKCRADAVMSFTIITIVCLTSLCDR